MYWLKYACAHGSENEDSTSMSVPRIKPLANSPADVGSPIKRVRMPYGSYRRVPLNTGPNYQHGQNVKVRVSHYLRPQFNSADAS